MKVLLSAGAAKDEATKHYSTALGLASLGDNVECVKELLAAKADVNKADTGGRTSHYGYVKIVKLLLAAGAKKDKITTAGDTALTLATEGGHHEVVQLLQQAA